MCFILLFEESVTFTLIQSLLYIMENKYICIHGHFYQPPRENAWLEVIEQQESAAPFHDWNERINFECYATNAVARILDTDNKIVNIYNNYSRMSFNIGATLLSWMEVADPDTYKLIQKADKESCKKYSGHGSAVAQAHSHLILPLANQNDKVTQVYWGLKDFESRFGRFPEGMWLAETAVNTESLEVLAAHGVSYTILAPRQAKAFKRLNAESWEDVVNENIDTRRPYLCKLPSGKTINLFFYNGNISQGVAFEGLLNSGKAFAQRLLNGFDNNDEPQLVNIATDGESYGHHHRLGEMALADCLNYIEEKSFAKLTNYAEYLEMFPPQYEAQIHENSSWSCVHGVERWRSDCGCNTGSGYGKWHQKWRAPLRFSLNWLRDQLIPIFEDEAAKYVRDPWAVRNEYIAVLLDRTEENIDTFLDKHASRLLTKREKVHLFRLLEMQRNAILMFSSCGWFFDEISGLETTQILQYACRAIHYAKQVADLDFEQEFTFRLSQAPSNLPQFVDGGGVYDKNVKPAHVDLMRVGMHYAASSLFEKYPEKLEFFNYIATSEFFERIESGNQILAIGRTTVRSKITHSEKHFSFAVLYLGQLNIIGNISLNMEQNLFDEMYERTSKAFKEVNLADVIGALQQYFGPEKFTIWQLFKEEKQRIINKITEKNLLSVEASFRKIYENNYQLMSGLLVSNVAIPEAFKSAVQYILNIDLKNFFMGDSLAINELKRILNEFQKWSIGFSDESAFKLAASERINFELKTIDSGGMTLGKMQSLNEVLHILNHMKVKPNVWKSQTLYFDLLKQFDSRQRPYPNAEWKKEFLKLGDLLNVKTEQAVLV
jgi:alpha-amylase/alpha-mannosidase (GH57 family)